MLKCLLISGFVLMSLLGFCTSSSNENGASWTPEETSIIQSKILWIIQRRGAVINQYKKMYPDRKYEAATNINAPKMLRLGFHDCLTYDQSELGSGDINGCDGCLNPDGMGVNLIKTYGDKKQFKGPNILNTNNNGLLQTADILEEVFTNKDFPKSTPSLDVSMKESGKSRADLWAFATLLATKYGVDQNNLACEGKGKDCGHLKILENDCLIHWSNPIQFRTGRKDCTPDPSLDRPFFTSKHEIHPNVHGNGIQTIDFYKTNFNLTAREAIALNGGAHSFGKFNAINSFFRYSWTRSQTRMLNNQMFLHYAGRPQYFLECKDYQGNKQFRLVGDSYGNKPNTTWNINSGGFSKDGGPFQWFHRYYRCPASNPCSSAWVEGQSKRSESTKSILGDIFQSRAEPNTPAGCCDNLEPGMYCQESCQKSIQNDETATPSETGFYWHFESDPVTGRPYGCPGLDNNKKWTEGKFVGFIFPKCNKEDYAPEGEPLHAIVDDFADNQSVWFEEFIPALEKMVENGYDDLLGSPMPVGSYQFT